MIKAVLLDRDGTLNVDKGYVYKVADLELLPGTIEALRLLTEKGIKIFIITNQAGIARGYYTESQFREFTQYMTDLFNRQGISIEQTLYCPHHPEGIVPEYARECTCRKPNTGLIEAVREKGGFRPREMVLIGDKNSDIEAGRRSGIRTYLVLTGYGAEHVARTHATHIAKDCLEAVRDILGIRE